MLQSFHEPREAFSLEWYAFYVTPVGIAAPEREVMRALTLDQPWVQLMAWGLKNIETRSWPAPRILIGQRIAIHAGKRKPRPTE